MTRIAIFWILLLSLDLAGQTEYRHFEVKSDGDRVGHLIASRNKNKEVTTYTVSSDVTIRVIFKLQMTNEIQAIFKDGILQYSSATLYLNNKVYSNTEIERDNGFYKVVKNDHASKILKDEIRFSSARLYWTEPAGEEYNLSETEGEMKDVEIASYRSYALSLDGSSKSVSTYSYSDTRGLSKIHVVRPFVPELNVYRVNSRSDLGLE